MKFPVTAALAALMFITPALCNAQATAGARSGANASAGGNIATGDANYSADENSKAAADKEPTANTTSSATKHHRTHALHSGDNTMPDNSTTSVTNTNTH